MGQLNKKETSDDSWASFVRKKRFLLHQKAVSTIANEIKKKAMNLWEKDQAGVGHKDLKQPSLRLIWEMAPFLTPGIISLLWPILDSSENWHLFLMKRFFKTNQTPQRNLLVVMKMLCGSRKKV